MIELIYTVANNAQLLDLCDWANWLPGIRSDKYPCTEASRIEFVDVRHSAPNFARHLEMVKRFHPRYAIVPDLSDLEVSREDVDRALRQADALAPHCEVVLFVPKLPGQIALLPHHLAIGYSVPTRYGGANYPIWELTGRRVHLLGGSPHAQLHLYRYISCLASVKSADGNMHQLMSGYGKFWRMGRWVSHPRRGSGDVRVSYECIRRSLFNIRQTWLTYFDYTRCPSCGDGLGLSWWCVFCQDARLSISGRSRTRGETDLLPSAHPSREGPGRSY